MLTRHWRAWNKKMKKYLIALVILLFPNFIFSNDTFFSLSGGNLIPATEDDVSIEMQEETITIDFQENFYEVTVDFVFYNSGNTVNLNVGFPFFAPGALGNGKIYDFRCWTNDKETSFEDLPIIRSWDSSNNQPKLENAYTRTIKFEKQKVTKTKIQYKSTYGRTKWDGYYLFGTGSAWKNSIGKINLIIINNLMYGYPEDIRMGKNIWGKSIKENIIKVDEKTYEIVLYNVEPEYNEIFYFHFEDILNDYGPKRFPAYFPFNKRITTSDELSIYKKDQLRIIRNAIYALHGYPFKSSDLQEYFKNVGKEWNPPYKINPDFSEDDLSDIEKQNIKTILEEENKR